MANPPLSRFDRVASSRFWAALACLAVIATTVWVYWPTRTHDFVLFDDPEYYTENPMVQEGLTWAGAKWALTTGYFSYWHPLTWLSLMLDVQLFGGSAAGPHLVNVGFHLANALLLFALLRRLTGAVWRSAMVAALFALHPLHVESVAWVAERKDVLSAFFFFLTLWAYARYGRERAAMRSGAPNTCHPERSEGSSTAHASGHPDGSFALLRMTKEDVHQQRSEESLEGVREPSWILRSAPNDKSRRTAWYLLALLFFACGLMSKPMVVTLPCVLLLLDFWPLGRFTPAATPVKTLVSLLREKVPFFGLTIVASAITLVAQRKNDALQGLDGFSLIGRIQNAFVAYARYLEKLVWPVNLAFFYPHPGGWSALAVSSAVLVLTGITVAVVGLWRRWPFAVMGWFLFLGMLVPTIGVIQVGGQAMADRYTYLPYIGLFIVAAWGAGEVSARWPRSRIAVAVAVTGILAACSWRSRDQLQYWRDSESLFRHALAVTDDNFMAHNNLGNALMRLGKVDEAIAHYERALAIRPQSVNPLNNLGTALLRKGRRDEAIARFEQVLRLQPNLAAAREALCATLLQAGRAKEAIPHLRKILADEPHNAHVHADLGFALLHEQRPDEAVPHFEQALAGGIDDADIRRSLGHALAQSGRAAEAIPQLERAAQAQPRSAEVHYELAIAEFQVGRPEAAIPHFEIVAEVQPTNAEALNNFGSTLLALGRYDEAVARFEAALKLEPSAATAHTNIALARIRQGRPREAIARYELLLRLQPEYAPALSGLAWLLATWPDEQVRDGARAVALALRANALSHEEDPTVLRALAAAQAETGQFTEALPTATRALQRAEASSNDGLAESIRAQIKSYQEHSPFREPATAGNERAAGDGVSSP